MNALVIIFTLENQFSTLSLYKEVIRMNRSFNYHFKIMFIFIFKAHVLALIVKTLTFHQNQIRCLLLVIGSIGGYFINT